MKMPPPTPADTLRIIASLHEQSSFGGLTSGQCTAGCDEGWPCATVHLAQGHGLLDRCQEEGWCVHYGAAVADPDEDEGDPDDDWDPDFD